MRYLARVAYWLGNEEAQCPVGSCTQCEREAEEAEAERAQTSTVRNFSGPEPTVRQNIRLLREIRTIGGDEEVEA